MTTSVIEVLKSKIEALDLEIAKLGQTRKSMFDVLEFLSGPAPAKVVVIPAAQDDAIVTIIDGAGRQGLSGKAIAEKAGLSEKAIHRRLRRLVAEKRIKRTGERRTTRYTVRKGK